MSRTIRVALVGCGSVSTKYLPNLRECPYVEVVAVADAIPARASQRAKETGVPNAFSSLDAMLSGVDFNFLINTTGMQTHFVLNKRALDAGKHVLCEKPIAGTVEQGQELLALAEKKGVGVWGAPNVVISPQFRFMVETLAKGVLGSVHAAHACYGHKGPSWGPWFYKKGGGSLFDLGVYNVTTLTGLLGPAKAVVAFAGTAIRERVIEDERVAVEADDSTMLLMDHGNAVYSHIQTGFVYGFSPRDRTIELIGTNGAMNLLGWDWAPAGVQVLTEPSREWTTHCEDAEDYSWQTGGSHLAECLVTGKRSPMTGEHAVHVLEVMTAALKSAETGRRVDVETTFPSPYPTPAFL
jgi:predicted dehydrogenase